MRLRVTFVHQTIDHRGYSILSACVWPCVLCFIECVRLLARLPWRVATLVVVCKHPNVVVPLLCADVDCPLRVACFLSPRSASLSCLRILLVSKPRDYSSRVRTRGFFRPDCGGDVSTNRCSFSYILNFSHHLVHFADRLLLSNCMPRGRCVSGTCACLRRCGRGAANPA